MIGSATRVMEEPPAEAAAPEAPRDRAIWVQANIIDRDEIGATSIDHYEGYAQWDEKTRDWLDARGMLIRINFEAEFHIRSWMELAERAQNCPASETSTDGNIYFWDHLGTAGSAGYYALCSVCHRATRVELADLKEGPFLTRQEAIAALTRLLSEPVPGILAENAGGDQ